MSKDYDREYAARLEGYIATERYTHAMYLRLAGLCKGEMSAALRRISADEWRHLKAMQMEYYLLTGDTCPERERIDTSGEMLELLRRAYSGEWEAADGYADEAERCADEKLRELYLAQSADEKRHRCMVKAMAERITGMDSGRK